MSRELFDAVQKVLDCAAQQAKDRGNTFLVPQSFERENFLRPLRTQPPPAKMRPQKDAGMYMSTIVSAITASKRVLAPAFSLMK